MLKQGELRGLSVRVRAVAALLSVFSLRALALVSPSFQVNSSQAVILRSLRVNRLATDSGKAFAQVDCVLRFEKFVFNSHPKCALQPAPQLGRSSAALGALGWARYLGSAASP